MANFTISTTRTDWMNQVAGSSIVNEDFNNGSKLHSGLQVFGGQYGTGYFEGLGLAGVNMGVNSPNRFEFIPFINAMAGDWDLSPGGPGLGLQLMAEFHSGLFQTIGFILNQDPTTPFKGFWGFTSDVPVQFFIFWGADYTGNGDEFQLTNLSFVQSSEPPHFAGTGRRIVYGGIKWLR